MPELTEGFHTAEFVLSEANGGRSREKVTIVSGQDLVAGEVLGKVTASGKYATHDQDAVDGTEAAAGVLWEAVDASAADKEGVALVRDCEVNGTRLTWETDITAGEITTATGELAALGVIIR